MQVLKWKGLAVMDANEAQLPAEALDFLANQRATSTSRTYAREIAAFLRAVGKSVQEVECRDLIAYRRTLVGNKPATVCRKLSTIRAFFQFLATGGYRGDNPAVVLKLPRNEHSSPYRILTTEELRSVISQPSVTGALGLRDRAILLLLGINGLRESEVLSINIEDLTDRDGFVVAAIQGKGSKLRAAKIAGTVADAVAAWRQLHAGGSGPLFVSIRGKKHLTSRRLSARSVHYRVRLYARKAGITRKVSPHALRHAAISHSLANGANIVQVKEMAGHASLNTTQRYLHSLDSIADNAVDYNPLAQRKSS
jgi:site-specific recombinase XerD